MTTPKTFISQVGLDTINTGTVAYKKAIEAIESAGKKVRACYTSGSGRYTSNRDHHLKTLMVLDLMEISYTTGNDAPRGGKTGQFIIVNADQEFPSWVTDYLKEKAEARAKAEAERIAFENRQASFKEAIRNEADAIGIDELFVAQIKWASEASGEEKSKRCASALKGLLERMGIEKINTDFWQVFRILKKMAK